MSRITIVVRRLWWMRKVTIELGNKVTIPVTVSGPGGTQPPATLTPDGAIEVTLS